MIKNIQVSYSWFENKVLKSIKNPKINGYSYITLWEAIDNFIEKPKRESVTA